VENDGLVVSSSVWTESLSGAMKDAVTSTSCRPSLYLLSRSVIADYCDVK